MNEVNKQMLDVHQAVYEVLYDMHISTHQQCVEAADKITDLFTAKAPTEQAQQAEPVALPPCNVFSNDDGDSWQDCPDDAKFVDGRPLGEEFELLAGWKAKRVTFRVTKVPDEGSDDYEVEQVTPPQTAQPPAVAVPEGYVLVPVEPTQKMVDAGFGWDDDNGEYWLHPAEAYRAMLAVAQKGSI